MSVKNLFFCLASAQKTITPLFSINGCGKKAPRCSPSSIFCIFHTRGLLSPPESEIRAGELLVGPGHLQEELVWGRPHHRYIKAWHHHPRVDRALHKNTCIADDHAKKLSEASVSLKWTELFSDYIALRICFLTNVVPCSYKREPNIAKIIATVCRRCY